MFVPLTKPFEWVQKREHQYLELPLHQPSLNHCPEEHSELLSTPHRLFQEQPVGEDYH